MTTPDLRTQILDYIGQDEIQNLFSSTHLNRVKSQGETARYHRNDSLLSAICNGTILGLINIFSSFDDRYAVDIIKRATHSGRIPLKMRITEIVTVLLIIIPLVIMVLDLLCKWTSLSAVFYIYASACGLSLYITARVAKREWMVHSWDEER